MRQCGIAKELSSHCVSSSVYTPEEGFLPEMLCVYNLGCIQVNLFSGTSYSSIAIPILSYHKHC